MQIETIRVMIVDDHQMVRETWKMILQGQQGIQVVMDCGSGAEAIKAAPSLALHVILMDVNMSPVSGFEATREILKSCPEIRIIGISINNLPGYARNMLQAGAKGFVTKNSTRQEMVQAILEVMNGGIYICQEVADRMT